MKYRHVTRAYIRSEKNINGLHSYKDNKFLPFMIG